MYALFLLPNGTFWFELVIFIVVLGIVAKFILPPISDAVHARERLIREAQRASDEFSHEADRLVAEREAVLQDARAQARALLEAATRAVDDRRQAAAPGIQAEHDQMLAAARAELVRERARAREEVGARLRSIVVQAAEQVLGSDVDETRHAEVIEAALDSARRRVGQES